jgi:mannitol/fructose-specific phosphotransferase system IIA component
VKKVVVASIPELVNIDGTETANLVLERFSEEHANVLQQLEAFPNLQYQVPFSLSCIIILLFLILLRLAF